MTYFHSVTLDKDKCRGCTNCIKRCPTEAIRVRGGKAKIIKARCIDCGECIRVCPYHAKRAVTDSFDELSKYKYNIALPAPSFYGQFSEVHDINVILTGLKQIGFDDVYEVARGAEYISSATRDMFSGGSLEGPVISSACPAVIRLIRVRFPNLIDKIIDLISPMEAAGQLARQEAAEKTGFKDDEIGVFFITPCPAKMTSIKSPITLDKSSISGAISVNDVFARLLPLVGEIKKPEKLMQASAGGVHWSKSGGEADGTGIENYIAVDGIENVIKVLEEIEDDKVSGIDFIELLACLGGCVGGVLNVENGFVAKNRLKRLTKNLPETSSPCDTDAISCKTTREIQYAPVMQLSEDLDEAMDMMDKLEEICDSLPGLDCGSCGAPSCHALAEDIVRGFADESFCIINIKAKLQDLINNTDDADNHEKQE